MPPSTTCHHHCPAANNNNHDLKDGDISDQVPIPISWRHPVPERETPNTVIIDGDGKPFIPKVHGELFYYTRQLLRRVARHGEAQDAFGERKLQKSSPSLMSSKKNHHKNYPEEQLAFNLFAPKTISAIICVSVSALSIPLPDHPSILLCAFISLHFLHMFIRFTFVRFRFWEKRLTPDRGHRAAVAQKGSYFDACIRIGPAYRRSESGDEPPPMNDHGIFPPPVVMSPSEQQTFYANSTMAEVYFMGYSRPGLMFADFMKVTMTVGLEFRANAVVRTMMYDMGLTRIAQQATTERSLFDCCLSTALACYADPACNDHLVFHNTTLPYRTNEKKCWDLIIFIIDYENERLKGIVTCEKADPRRGEIIPPPNALIRLAEVALKQKDNRQGVEIPPSGILELNTDDAEESVANRFNLDRDKARWPKCNLVISGHELGVLCVALIAFKAHVSTHWLASGVGDAVECWPLANTCNEVTQYFNSQATFTSHIPLGNTSTDQVYILAKNPLTEGLPMHSHLSKYGSKSKLRRISGPARKKLRELWPTVSQAIIEAVLAATIFHAVDHFYGDQVSFNGISAFLQNDLSLFRLVLVGPCTYYSRNLLVRQHLDDPVCKILYDSCKAVDPYLADHCLFLGICN